MQKELTTKVIRNMASAILLLVAFSVVSQAQEVTTQKNPAIKIKNFGQMDERFYRGARPKPEDFRDLAAMGIKTVIDLTEDPKEDEKLAVESSGMKYVHIPMVEKQYPTEQATNLFMRVANDPVTGKFYVHCAGGRHRTGAMGAVYRFQNYNWNFDQVYAEMQQYDFYTSWGHGAFKNFVKDYYDHMQAAKAAGQSAPIQESGAGQMQDRH